MQERLQKSIAHAGIASRRKAERLIAEGRVSVNGKTVTELGAKADPQKDRIKVDEKVLQIEGLVYFALNKPKGVISAASDPVGRPVVTDLIPTKARIYPAGRLDYQSEGLVILTNDGEMARKIMESGRLAKVYLVKVMGTVSEIELNRLRRGVRWEETGEQFGACRVRPVRPGENAWYEVILYEGKNRQVRRMFEAVGHRVLKLRRHRIGPLELGDLKPGQWRRMTDGELRRLRLALDPPKRSRKARPKKTERVE